jgi:hypothetical protein
MKLYKLTDENDRTRNNTQWGEGVSHSGTGEGEMCSEGWIHAYRDPILAVLMNPVHGDFSSPHLWEAKGRVSKDDGTKVGCKTLTTTRRLDIPVVTMEQRIRFGILCAKQVCDAPGWLAWAVGWLTGKDRCERSAWVVACAARWEPERAAAHAAGDAAWAEARCAVEVARNAWMSAANAATETAKAAKKKDIAIDFVALAHEAVKNETKGSDE